MACELIDHYDHNKRETIYERRVEEPTTKEAAAIAATLTASTKLLEMVQDGATFAATVQLMITQKTRSNQVLQQPAGLAVIVLPFPPPNPVDTQTQAPKWS